MLRNIPQISNLLDAVSPPPESFVEWIDAKYSTGAPSHLLLPSPEHTLPTALQSCAADAKLLLVYIPSQSPSKDRFKEEKELACAVMGFEGSTKVRN